MKSILFTKALDPSAIQDVLGESGIFVSTDFIEIHRNAKDEIRVQLPETTSYYLVSSARAANQIKNFELNRPFYIVGNKSKEILENAGHKIAYCAETAQALLYHIKSNVSTNEKFTFFCSNIRRDTLPIGLENLGHHVHEIVCYETRPKQVNLENTFDLYVFFSPSGVKSFAQQYDIPKKASIFAIGKTTSDAVAKEIGLQAEFPPNADVNSLLQLIKTRIDAEK